MCVCDRNCVHQGVYPRWRACMHTCKNACTQRATL